MLRVWGHGGRGVTGREWRKLPKQMEQRLHGDGGLRLYFCHAPNRDRVSVVVQRGGGQLERGGVAGYAMFSLLWTILSLLFLVLMF